MPDSSATDARWTPQKVKDGEWAGWTVWSPDPFELLAGPFYTRQGDDGQRVCAFRAERKHMNGHGAMHGGCLMTFADYAVFAIGSEAIQGAGSVTAQMNCDFVDAAFEGEFVECAGEVTRAGASLVFIRGQIRSAGRIVMSFSCILKRTRPRPLSV